MLWVPFQPFSHADCPFLYTRPGDIYTWGDGFGGKLGHGGIDTCLQPRKVEKLAGMKVTSVTCGVWHTACLVIEGNSAEEAEQKEPTQSVGTSRFGRESLAGIEPALQAASRATSVSSGHSGLHGKRVSRLKDRGVVWVWGGGDRGCLGVGDEEGRMEPVEMHPGPESVRQIAAGLHFTVMLSVGGKVWMCGSTVASGFDGQTVPPWEGSLTPMRVKGALSGLIATHVASGMQHVAVIAGAPGDPMSQLYTWGSGTEGQLGHGSALPGASPSCPEPCLVKHLQGRSFIQALRLPFLLLPASPSLTHNILPASPTPSSSLLLSYLCFDVCAHRPSVPPGGLRRLQHHGGRGARRRGQPQAL